MEEKPKVAMDVVRYTHLGLSFLLLVLLPILGGHWLDGRTGSSPLWTLLGAAAGFASGMYYLVVSTRSIR